MQVTDEMIERACKIHNVGWSVWREPQKRTAREVMRLALTAALSAEQTRPVAVKALGWVTCGEVSFSSTPFGSYEIRENTPRFANDAFELVVAGEKIVSASFATEVLARSAAQADYETRIRSALVDVPAEPVCTVALIGAAGFRWLAPHPINALDHLPVGTPLYTSPPLSREGEDTAEVVEAGERFLKACDAYVDGEEIPDETLMVEYGDALEAFRTVLAATRSGSATASNGDGDE